jgi:S-adenosylmethionine hydrolase
MSRPVITLTTDFGQADGYVGTMKGVILGICPQAALVDISHEIRPQAVGQAAYVLHTAVPYFPPGTVHLVVVDPGVGSARRPIVVQTDRATYVAPDNGVLTLSLARDPARLAVELAQPDYRLPLVSATFHGRDIFAPAAAHLARGTGAQAMGDAIPLASLVALPTLQPQQQPDGAWQGQVLHVDRFGNVVTNLQSPMINDQFPLSMVRVTVKVGAERVVGLSRTFADVAPGELVAYVGSSGYLEIAVREGNAAARLGADVGSTVWGEGLP